MRKRRKVNYKFTEKNHSVKGIVGLVTAVLSIIFGIGMIVISFLNQGNGTVYLGSGGVLALLIALAAFLLAMSSMREEKSYKVFPIAAAVVSVLSLAGGITLYIIGFLGM